MGDLLGRAWPFVLPGLLPVPALLHLPLLGRRGRMAWAALLGAIAASFVGDVLLLDHGGVSTLQVKTVFGRGEHGELHAWVVEQVSAPAWQWHLVVASWFALTGGLAWLHRNRPPAPPRPLAWSLLAFGSALAARLALEKTAAPEPIVWAVGVSAASFAIMPFFGWYCGARGHRFGRFVVQLLLANALQRLAVVVVGYVATMGALGTHLDTHSIPEITAPGIGRVGLTGPQAAWVHAILLPQMTFALVLTAVLGLVIGALPWWLARRGARAAGRS